MAECLVDRWDHIADNLAFRDESHCKCREQKHKDETADTTEDIPMNYKECEVVAKRN